MKEIIKVQGLNKSYSNREIIKNLSFSVFEGEFLSIIGDSGAGKSTLLYLLAGIEKPDSGNIFIDDIDITKISDVNLQLLRQTKFGFVFQFDNLINTMTIWDNIVLPLIISKKFNKNKEKEVLELLKYLKIDHIKDSFPALVSGGEQQRASIARALVINPKIIFLDEPTGSLDSKSGQLVMDYLIDINKSKNVTVLQVTHNEQYAKISSRVIKVKDGGIIDV